MSGHDFYQTLGVHPTASQEDIKTAFKARASPRTNPCMPSLSASICSIVAFQSVACALASRPSRLGARALFSRPPRGACSLFAHDAACLELHQIINYNAPQALALKHHPDRHPNAPTKADPARRFQLISEAYDTLVRATRCRTKVMYDSGDVKHAFRGSGPAVERRQAEAVRQQSPGWMGRRAGEPSKL